MSKLKADRGKIFESGKTYTHAQGLSCCFRQWRATDSHCRFLHGYALQVTLTFRSEDLDDRNWVMDFGGLKSVKGWLEEMFDHKLVVARDDPNLGILKELELQDLAELNIVEHVGCEAFAKMIFDYVSHWVKGAFLECVEVREHEGNFARYRRDL